MILTGIENVAVRGDLADRALIVRLAPIAETDRRIELDLWADFEEARPRILGALLQGLCEGFRQLPKVKLRRLPRMADFATWSAACEGAFWSAGTFMAAYDKALASATEDVLEDSSVWPALRKFLERERIFDGTASQLLSLLNADRQDEREPKGWPARGASLGKMLSRLAPSMRQLGFAVQLTRTSRGNHWRLETPLSEAGDGGPGSSFSWMRPYARIGVTQWSSNPRRKESDYRIPPLLPICPHDGKWCPAWIQLQSNPSGRGAAGGPAPRIQARPGQRVKRSCQRMVFSL